VKPKSFEAWLESHPLRPFVREQSEVKPLRRAADFGAIPRALHIECKDGVPTAQIMKHFPVDKVTGIDRDEGLVAAARANPACVGADFSVGDVRSLGFTDGTFDAVFDLAELHNYADWERGLHEIHRVLKHGGLLILEELSIESFSWGAGRLFKALTEHPYDVMFTADAFRDRVRETGFEIASFDRRRPFGLLKYFTMIARKA
jgi:SAM-dependent methyltransferase